MDSSIDIKLNILYRRLGEKLAPLVEKKFTGKIVFEINMNEGGFSRGKVCYEEAA